MRLAQDPRLEQRILAWNDGNKGYKARPEAPASVTAARRAPILTSHTEFESAVDDLNRSRVARDLAEVTGNGKGLLRHFSSGSEEPQGIKASLGKMKEVVGKVFDKAMRTQS